MNHNPTRAELQAQFHAERMNALAWRNFKRNSWCALHTLATVAMVGSMIAWALGVACYFGLFSMDKVQALILIKVGIFTTVISAVWVLVMEATVDYWR